jgi:TonB family protein
VKPLRLLWLFAIALVFNAFLFLLVPTMQAAMHGPVAKKKDADSAVTRELAPPTPEPEKIVQREIREVQMEPISEPQQLAERPSAPGGGLKLDLSAAGGSGAMALVSGGDRSGPLGSGTGGGSGSGQGAMVYEPGQTDADARIVGADPAPKYPPRAEREGVSGYADLLWIVNESGFATQIQVLKEEPVGYGFGAAASEALRKLRFQPAMVQKTPVKQKLRRRWNFEQ